MAGKAKVPTHKNFAIGLAARGIGDSLVLSRNKCCPGKPPSRTYPPARRQIEEDLRGYLDWITQAEDLEIDPTTTPHVAAAASAASRKASSAAIAEVKALQEGDGEDGCSPSQQPAANGTGSDGDNGSGAVLLPP